MFFNLNEEQSYLSTLAHQALSEETDRVTMTLDNKPLDDKVTTFCPVHIWKAPLKGSGVLQEGLGHVSLETHGFIFAY